MPYSITKADGSIINVFTDAELDAQVEREATKQWQLYNGYRATGQLDYNDGHGDVLPQLDEEQARQVIYKLTHCLHISSMDPPPVHSYEDCVRNHQVVADRLRTIRDQTIEQAAQAKEVTKQQHKVSSEGPPERQEYLNKCRERKEEIKALTNKWRACVKAYKEISAIMDKEVRNAKAAKKLAEETPAPPMPKDQPPGYEYPDYNNPDLTVTIPHITAVAWNVFNDAGVPIVVNEGDITPRN